MHAAARPCEIYAVLAREYGGAAVEIETGAPADVEGGARLVHDDGRCWDAGRAD